MGCTTFEPSYAAYARRSSSRSGLSLGSVMRLLLPSPVRTISPTATSNHTWASGGIVAERLTAPCVIAVAPLDAAEMARELREAGLPVSGLAEIMGVERKTVYAWLDGSDARATKLARLETVHGLLSREGAGALRLFHRHWDRHPTGCASLHDLLTADTIDVGQARAALDALRPSVVQALERERRRETDNTMGDGPSGLANLHMVATTGR